MLEFFSVFVGTVFDGIGFMGTAFVVFVGTVFDGTAFFNSIISSQVITESPIIHSKNLPF